MANSYTGFSDLSRIHKRGIDYEITVLKKPKSNVAIVAPHGGRIERRTSEIARTIAASDFNLYLFEGIRSDFNYETLHLTSHYFDEPDCLDLVKDKQYVITIHGCNAHNKDEQACVFLGGRDTQFKNKITNSLRDKNIIVETDNHRYPGIHKNNICNRGLSNKGVQIELTDELRGTKKEVLVIEAVRNVLLELD